MNTTPQRSDAGFGNALEDFDPNAWKPKPRSPSAKQLPREEATAAIQAAGFRSREPRNSEAPKQGRPPTGRSVPLSLKISADTRALMDRTLEKVNEGQRVRIPMGELLHRAFLAYAREIELDLSEFE